MNEKFVFSVERYYGNMGCYGQIICQTENWDEIFALCQKIIAILGDDRNEPEEDVRHRLFCGEDFVALGGFSLAMHVEIGRILKDRIVIEPHPRCNGYEGNSFSKMEAAVKQAIS